MNLSSSFFLFAWLVISFLPRCLLVKVGECDVMMSACLDVSSINKLKTQSELQCCLQSKPVSTRSTYRSIFHIVRGIEYWVTNAICSATSNLDRKFSFGALDFRANPLNYDISRYLGGICRGRVLEYKWTSRIRPSSTTILNQHTPYSTRWYSQVKQYSILLLRNSLTIYLTLSRERNDIWHFFLFLYGIMVAEIILSSIMYAAR